MVLGVDSAPTVQGEALRPMTLKWVLKRSLAGFLILFVAMGALAWLTYASIDPDLDGDLMPRSADAVRGAPPPVVPIGL